MKSKYEIAREVCYEYDAFLFDGGKKGFMAFLEKNIKSEKPTSQQQSQGKINCLFCGSKCICISGESEWVRCGKCGKLHRK
jgi:hypothetical protein